MARSYLQKLILTLTKINSFLYKFASRPNLNRVQRQLRFKLAGTLLSHLEILNLLLQSIDLPSVLGSNFGQGSIRLHFGTRLNSLNSETTIL